MKLPATHPWFPWVFFEYFGVSEGAKVDHVHSGDRHGIGFQHIVYLKSNKWRAKILKNINKKNSTWCVKLIRRQEIILFRYRVTKCPTEAEKIDFVEDKNPLTLHLFHFKWMMSWGLILCLWLLCIWFVFVLSLAQKYSKGRRGVGVGSRAISFRRQWVKSKKKFQNFVDMLHCMTTCWN